MAGDVDDDPVGPVVGVARLSTAATEEDLAPWYKRPVVLAVMLVSIGLEPYWPAWGTHVFWFVT